MQEAAVTQTKRMSYQMHFVKRKRKQVIIRQALMLR